jgi:hypothetical protein
MALSGPKRHERGVKALGDQWEEAINDGDEGEWTLRKMEFTLLAAIATSLAAIADSLEIIEKRGQM